MASTRTASLPPPVLNLLAHQVRWQILAALARSDHRVFELVQLLDRPMNLISYHLKRLKLQGLIAQRRSSADKRDVYYSANLPRLRALKRC